MPWVLTAQKYLCSTCAAAENRHSTRHPHGEFETLQLAKNAAFKGMRSDGRWWAVILEGQGIIDVFSGCNVL